MERNLRKIKEYIEKTQKLVLMETEEFPDDQLLFCAAMVSVIRDIYLTKLGPEQTHMIFDQLAASFEIMDNYIPHESPTIHQEYKMPQKRRKIMRDLLRPPGRSQSTARERAIARSGKKGQPNPLNRILSKSKTGKPSPHVDRPKPRKRMTTDDLKKLIGRRKKAGRATPMKKGGPAAKPVRPASKSPGRIAPKLGGIGKAGKPPKSKAATTTFHKSKAAAAKDKGKPNTPGEQMRRLKGGLTMGKIRTKKMLSGVFDKGKKIRYQRRGK